MERVHDPIIFQNALDGIDLKNHIVATYYISDRLPGVEFIDHYKLIEAMAIEGSTGTWQKVAEDTEAVRLNLSGKLVGYFELPSDDEYCKAAVIQLAFPINAWRDNVPMMLLSIAGNCFAYSQDLRLLDVFLPEDMVKNFKGTGDQVYQTAIGGADMCKDDEMTSDTYNNDFRERLKYVMETIDRAAQKTGKRMIYYCSITDEVSKLKDKAHEAVELGANGLLITYSVGLSAIRQITEDPEINIPVMVHNSHMIAAMKSISWPVFTKLIRLCGADQTLTPTYWSSIPMVSLEEGIRCQHVGQAPFHHIKPIWAMPAAGTYPGLAHILISEYGKDIIIPSGGGMLGHPDGYTAGAKAWQQAIASAMQGVHIAEHARKPANKALRRALEKWGYLERPSTPWLRVAPKFHPKPFKMQA
jgi:2,3-diketo-5-methylthiopentyl-1-phosphate enolase